MTLRRAMTKDGPVDPLLALTQNRHHSAWMRPDFSASLAGLNEQYIELLCTYAASTTTRGAPAFVRELQPFLSMLDATGRRRAAACPYLLMDAGFADAERWSWARAGAVREAAPELVERHPALPEGEALSRMVFILAWHLARADMSAARMILGMSDRTAEVLVTCSLPEMTQLAELHTHWLQPRWPTHMRMWRELFAGALKGEGQLLDQARMRGVQLLAAEARSSALR